MIRQPTEQQWRDLEALVDSQGGERPYRRIISDGYAYVISERDLPPEQESEAVDGPTHRAFFN
jgi:hypothetical protein